MNRRTQQFDLYDAERMVPLALRGTQLVTQAGVQDWVNRYLLGQPWWNEQFPKVRGIEVMPVRRTGGSVGGWDASTYLGYIEMSTAHLSPMYICHEVAHVTSIAMHDSDSHDPYFAKHYCDLVFRTLGFDTWSVLRSRFQDLGVCFDPRCLTEKHCGCGS